MRTFSYYCNWNRVTEPVTSYKFIPCKHITPTLPVNNLSFSPFNTLKILCCFSREKVEDIFHTFLFFFATQWDFLTRNYVKSRVFKMENVNSVEIYFAKSNRYCFEMEMEIWLWFFRKISFDFLSESRIFHLKIHKNFNSHEAVWCFQRFAALSEDRKYKINKT